MRIEVTGEDDPNNTQARAYAEYKVFAALAHHTQRVRSAQVVLQREHLNGRCDSVQRHAPSSWSSMRGQAFRKSKREQRLASTAEAVEAGEKSARMLAILWALAHGSAPFVPVVA